MIKYYIVIKNNIYNILIKYKILIMLNREKDNWGKYFRMLVLFLGSLMNYLYVFFYF